MKDYNWKKLIIVVVSCTILGGIVGMLTNMIISNNPIAFLEMIEPKFYYLYIAAAIIGTISLLFCGYFFTTIKREGFSEDEGSFYQRNENKITVAMSMSTICGVLNFTALGLTITSEEIGRASCRERVLRSVYTAEVRGFFKKKLESPCISLLSIPGYIVHGSSSYPQ